MPAPKCLRKSQTPCPKMAAITNGGANSAPSTDATISVVATMNSVLINDFSEIASIKYVKFIATENTAAITHT